MATQVAPSIPSKRLAAAILSTDMAFSLNNILSWDAVNNLVSGDFSTTGRGVFRNPQNTQIEFFTFDPTTIANSTITILARGLDYKGGTTDGIKTKYNWPAGTTIVELGSNPPAMLEDYMDKISDETVAGLKTFSTLPQSSAVPVAATDLVNKLYADGKSPVSTYDQNIIAGVAGEALTVGWAVYLKTSDGKWYGTLATGSSTSEGVLLGIAQATVALGAAINVLIGGVDKNQSGLTLGSTYFLSDTKGLIATSAGTKSVVIGQCNTTATQLVLSQRFTQVPTKQQINALAGNSGTPDTGNEFVTKKGLQLQTENYAIDSSGAANTITLTLSPVPTAYVAGMVIRVKVVNATTGPTVVNANVLGNKTVKKYVSGAIADLGANDIVVNQVVTLVYEATSGFFILQTPPAQLSLTKISVDTSTQTVANDNTLKTFATHVIPGGTLGTSNGIRGRINLSDIHNAGTAGTFTLTVIYGATTIFTISFTFDTVNSQTSGSLDFVILANAATNAQVGSIMGVFGASELKTTPAISANAWLLAGNGTAAEDSTASKNLVIKGQWGAASANLSMAYAFSEVEKIV